MIFDAQDMDRTLFDRTFDICVVGSGPAGMTLARTLAATGLSVALMEGGGLDLTDESQSLYEGEVVGLDNFELDVSRLRFFGGSSNHWHGQCKGLEDIDFLPRPYQELSGWPIRNADLDPYKAAADEILDIPGDADFQDQPVPAGDGAFRRIFWRRSPPTRFGPKYQDEIAATANLALCLNANLVDMRLNDALDTVTAALFKSFTPDDPGFTVKASRYCLCLGGLENARMLLNFRSQMPQGIGNQNGLVGKYFHDHVAVDVADILLEKPLDSRDVSYAPSKAFQGAHEALSMVFVLVPTVPQQASLSRQLIRTAECVTPAVERMVETLRHETIKCKAGGLTELLLQRDPEKYPTGVVTSQSEQPLTEATRVVLNDEVDPFGLQRITLDWVLPDDFYVHLREATIALGGVLAETGVGRIKLRNWLLEDKPLLPRRDQNVGDIGARHHMGTTRMADDPTRGVVDADCRVHGISNLYIGGSSVFPTGGYVNPTYTIVKMTLRLADHIGSAFRA